MQHQIVKALVIRETDFGDADRFITVLTEQGARMEILCRGVRRRGAQQLGAVRLFCWSELTVYRGRGGKFTLNEASLLHSFWSVTADMETYALCCYLAELAGAMTEEGAAVPAVTRLMLYALRAAADQRRPPALVKAAFELRLMAESGFAPALAVCGACQNQIEGGVYFSVREGVVLDGACLRRLGGADAIVLPGGAYAAMLHIVSCEIPRVFSFTVGEDSVQRLCEVCERYALHYAERGFGSLEFYHSLLT